MTTELPEWLIYTSEFAKIIASLVAMSGIYIAIGQLIRVDKNVKFSALSTIVNLENELNKRKIDIETINEKILKLDKDENKTLEEIEVFEATFRVYIENYLNVVSRLCYCIQTGYISEEQWKDEYYYFITDLVDEYKKDPNLVSILISYQNIMTVYDTWKKNKTIKKKRTIFEIFFFIR